MTKDNCHPWRLNFPPHLKSCQCFNRSYLKVLSFCRPSVETQSANNFFAVCTVWWIFIKIKKTGALSAVWLSMQMPEWSLPAFSWSSSPMPWVQPLLFHTRVAKALYDRGTRFHFFQVPNLSCLDLVQMWFHSCGQLPKTFSSCANAYDHVGRISLSGNFSQSQRAWKLWISHNIHWKAT